MNYSALSQVFGLGIKIKFFREIRVIPRTKKVIQKTDAHSPIISLLALQYQTLPAESRLLHQIDMPGERKVLISMFRQQLGRLNLKLRRKNNVIGWTMTPDETRIFFQAQGKTVLTFFGYSSFYEDEKGMLQIAQEILSGYSPATTLINIGATTGGVGAIYPLAKSMGFTTTGIVTNLALYYPESISNAVDHVCFIADKQWGGNLPNSNELSPTSKAMVACSDILIGIGGGEISRDEMVAGKTQGKPVTFYPAEVNHAWAIRRAKRMGLPSPDSFLGAAHEVFGNQ